MKIYRAYKIRIYPNKSQQEILDKTFGCCRFLWNKMLNERILVYQKLCQDKEQLYSYKYKTEKQYKSEFEFLKEVDSKALQTSTANLSIAFKKFFKGLKQKRKVGYPKFKSRKHNQSYSTYNITKNIKIDFDQKQIKLPKIKTWIKYRDNRVFIEAIRKLTISKTKTGKYFASILTERNTDVISKQEISISKIASFDMSLSNFLISPLIRMKNPRFYRNEENRIKKLHRQLSRKKIGSSNREKARQKLSRKYKKIYNRKKDWTHKISTDLATEYEVIILEDLNIKGIQQFNTGISKSVTLDFSWGQFLSILRYKMYERGNHLILIDKWFPSSRLCSQCGWKNEELNISDRRWTCKKCRMKHDRDINASKNLFKEGIKLLKNRDVLLFSTVGTTGSHACGDDRRLSIRKHLSMKQESTIV